MCLQKNCCGLMSTTSGRRKWMRFGCDRILTSSRCITTSDFADYLYPDHADQFFHRRGTLVETGFLFWVQSDLNDLLDPLCPQLHRHSDVKPIDPVFTL